MLQYIRIKNLALMDEVELEFDAGLSVVTGETGAGKSVLLGALALLAGNRVDKTIIRKGEAVCEVEASLYCRPDAALHAQMEALGLPPCEEDCLVLRRSVFRQKAGRVQINGALSTLTALQEISECWIDFHGPGEPQKLFKERYQLAMLDLFARNQNLLMAYQLNYERWKQLLSQAEELQGSERLSEDEIAFTQSQIETIDQLELSDEAVLALERDFNRIDQARDIVAASEQLQHGLCGDEGVLSQLMGLVRNSQDLATIDKEGELLHNRFNSLMLELEDLAGEYGQLASNIDFDAETAASIQQRMGQWLELKRKYGPTVKSVLAKRATLAERIAMQADIEGSLQALYDDAAKVEQQLLQQGDTLLQQRQQAALQLAKQAQKLLGQLGFKKAKLKIAIHADSTLREYGNSHCQFLFSANAGQDVLPLNKIASSGETARVMLALKAVLAQVDATPVLVFDEVDANVGGEIGAAVGRELRHLAGEHQVFCVTHLPQVAAQGKQHFVVSKVQSKQDTTVSIQPIHADAKLRETELARMLGDRKSKAAIEHARELLACK